MKRIILSTCLFFLLCALPCSAQIRPTPTPIPRPRTLAAVPLLTVTNFAPLQGAQGRTLTLTINGTGFGPGSQVQFLPGTGIMVSGVQVSSQQITAQVQITQNAPLGPQSINVITGGVVATAQNVFTVTPAVPPTPITITGFAPPQGAQGSTFTLTINGTGFGPGDQVQFLPNSGITVPGIQISNQQITAQVQITPTSPTSARQIQVIPATGGPGVTAPGVFTVTSAAPPPPPVPPPTLTITGFAPSQTAQGSSFPLTITGSGFASVVQVQFLPNSGITLSGVQISSQQITAQVKITPTAPTIVRQIQVITANGSVVTAPGFFTVTPAVTPPPTVALPTLTEAGPRVVAQASQNIRLTLRGTNFRNGAKVVISPPLARLSDSTASLQANDVVVQNVVRISDTLLLAEISVSRQAASGLRAVDVVNVDGANTGTSAIPGTSQPLNISAGNSLAAPLNVTAIDFSYSRDGIVLSQGDDIYGAAVLAGTGTGMVIGEWLWDGNAIEQFSVLMTGGGSVRLKTTRALPSDYLGPHTLALRVNWPNQLQTRSIDLVVNPGTWKLEKLLAPLPDATFSANSTPSMQWARVPGADHYQVGFATQPFYSSVERWYDTRETDWQVREKIWKELPDGQIYWTVRVVDISGDTRHPLPMRSLWKLPGTSFLRPLVEAPQEGRGILLHWQPVQGEVLYRVSIFQNEEGTDVMKRFLTRGSRLDFSAERTGLRAGQTYFCRVEVFSGSGRLIVRSPVQGFAVPGVSARGSRGRNRPYQVAAAGGLPGPPSPASLIAARFPEPQGMVRDRQPIIKIGFTDKINPAELALSIDSYDVTTLAKIHETGLTLALPVAFTDGAHQVTIQIGNDSDSWSFMVAGKKVKGPGEGNVSAQKSDAEVSPAPPESVLAQQEATPGRPSKPTGLQELSGQVAANTQGISDATSDTNTPSLAGRMIFRKGPWISELNGTGLLNSVLSSDLQHALGRVNDYVVRSAYEKPHWNAGFSFGLLAPSLYSGSEFVTTGSAREAVETWVGTPAGKFSFLANTNDHAPGAGIGNSFHQGIQGASYSAPIPEKIGELRFMWLGARDTGLPTDISFTPTGTLPPVPPPLPGFPIPPSPTTSFVANPAAGDAYGALFLMHLGSAWTWNSEYALSYENPNLTLTLGRLFGRAWKSGVSGSWKKATINVAFRDVTANFGSPANPSLTPNSNPDRRGVDASVSSPFVTGTLTAAYQFLQSGVHSSTTPILSLDSLTLNWSRNLTPTNTVQIGGRDVLTRTGDLPPAVLSLTSEQQLALRADSRDAGLDASISHNVGKIALTTGVNRDWLRNDLLPQQNVITSGVNAGANWQAGLFKINSNASVNWVAADKFTLGENKFVTMFIQPIVTWQRTGIAVSPLFTFSSNRTLLNTGALTVDNFTSQYSARVTWQMPRGLRFSTLSLEGGQVHLSNAIANSSRTDNRLLVLWNLVGGYQD